jgi:DnaJ-class molecular chaperone
VGVAKWKLQHGTKPKLYELFGLQEKYTKAQLRKAYNLGFTLALHSDRNLDNKEESDILFKLSQDINDQLTTDLEKREQLRNQ